MLIALLAVQFRVGYADKGRQDSIRDMDINSKTQSASAKGLKVGKTLTVSSGEA